MRMSRPLAILWTVLGLAWGAGSAQAVTGLDGRWYPTYRRGMVRWAQQALKAQGLYAGPVTGALDGATMDALKRFQTTAGLRPSGVPTPFTRRALRALAPGLKPPAEPAFRGAGTVVGRVGQVRITRAGPPPRGVPREFLRRVDVHDLIETGPDGKAMVQLDDGSTLILGNNSRVNLRDFASAPAEREKSVLLEATRGVLRLVAHALADAGENIRVQGTTAFAAVRGTDWLMRITPEATALFVEEGSVAVMNIGPDAKQIVVPEGRGSDVAAGKQPTEPAAWAPERIQDLRRAVAYP
jgi:ferric-dicitrate binding protein FerR (iron transport regulator)